MSNALVTSSAQPPAFTLGDMERIAHAFAASKLFGVQTPEQALALCLVAHAEGRHPAIAAQDYNIINGRPSKKADAMLRDFIASGGRVEWHTLSDQAAEATFAHPQGGTVRIGWDHERAKAAGINNPMWRKYPRQMLRSRVVSEGVRTVCPGATSGMYVPEEVQDFGAAEVRADIRDVTPQREEEPPLEGTPQPRKSIAQARADKDWETLTGEMNACSTGAELVEWGRKRAFDIGALPASWETRLRSEWLDLKRKLPKDENTIALPTEGADDEAWEAYFTAVLQIAGGAQSHDELAAVEQANGDGVQVAANFIEAAPDRFAAVIEQRHAELASRKDAA